MGLTDAVQTFVEEQISAGRHYGTQVSVYRHGRQIVDLSAGRLGPADPRPVQPSSLFCSFSTTKGVAAAAVHVAADRGLIDYDAPVAQYWPEFGASGKTAITVSQAMSHQAGLHTMPDPLTARFFTDWEAGKAHIAAMAPAWEPGTMFGYHAWSYAWIVGGIVEGATGRRFGDFLREAVARPLGIEDELFIGIPDGVEERLATLEEPPLGFAGGVPFPPGHRYYEAVPRAYDFSFNDMAVRRACIPSANGHFSARALSRLYGALANGGELDGTRLVSPERVAAMQQCVFEGVDCVVESPFRRGIGFNLGGAASVPSKIIGPRKTAFGHTGAGGSVAFADPDTGLAVAITINKMEPPMSTESLTLQLANLIRCELGIGEP